MAIGDGTKDLKAHLSIAFHAKPVVRARADCLDAVINLFEP